MRIDNALNFGQVANLVPRLEVLESVESTNSYMATRLSWEPFSLVLTLSQTLGRGRLGRSWESSPGEALAFSLLVPADLSNVSEGLPTSWIPLIAGACLVDAVRVSGVNSAEMKWPNDVLVKNKKLAGILCEHLTSGRVIVGVGINLQFHGAPPTENAIALFDASSKKPPAPDALLASFVKRMTGMWSSSPEEIKSCVLAQLGTLGREVVVAPASGDTWRGKAESLDGQGSLMVRRPTGELTTVSASDVYHLHQ